MYQELFDNIKELKKNSTIAVAVSGGIDSLSLTLIANEWCKKNGIKLIAITVDHLLRKSSTEEALYINSLLKSYDIEHHILTWDGEKPKNNIENIAREARYNLMFDFCRKNNINTILLAHHIQDQAENFIIRLFRGSGIKGLSSMNIISYRNDFCIIRPFLNITKEELKKYLENKNIKWIEDESNSDERYLRNKIRAFLNSFPDKKNIINRINETVKTLQLAENIIKKNILDLDGKVYNYNKYFDYYIINIEEFYKIEEELQLRILSKISKLIGQTKNSARVEKIQRLLEIFKDIKKYTFNHCIFEKINSNQIICFREYNSIKNKEGYLKIGEFNNYFKFLKEQDYKKYKLIKNLKGYKKEIVYTIPIEDLKTKKFDLL